MPGKTCRALRYGRPESICCRPCFSGCAMSIDHYEIDEKEREQQKAFLGFGEADAANVRALRAVFAEHAESFADQFYEHLLANPHTASFLRDPQQLAELKTLQ